MSHTFEILLALGVLFPFLSFWALVFFGPKLGKPGAGWFAVVGGMGLPLVCSTIVLIGWMMTDNAGRTTLTEGAHRFSWAMLGSIDLTVGVKLDSLTVAMYFMVTLVATLIFIFSVGYMAGHSDEVDGRSKYHRFFAYLCLFAFSMLGLVVSSSLLFLFIFWELVGLCSYLLIGYYFHERIPQYAQMKAFITNRVGDFGFIIGMMLVALHLNTLDLDGAAAAFATQYADGAGIFASTYTLFGYSLATLMGIGLFCGAMGKSAQFPLHVWLPDAMAGPTPVSALIHAATMVAAGVYLVARVFRLMTPDALMFIAVIGCLTLTLMALVAMVQTDIKKCLAYSTLSQLGYMIFGMGCGAWIAALFHLITHAFFKAMLFLGSGQVIEGCHHEQDMRKMGGLRHKMPVTCWTFFIGVLAIAGTGIPGLDIGLGGYRSKDEILAVAYTRAYEWDDHHKFEEHATTAVQDGPPVQLATMRQDGEDEAAHTTVGNLGTIFENTPPLPKWMFWLAIITAYITPFYMMRAWWMTFMGKPRDENVYEHAHESKLMYLPLVALAVGTFVATYWIFRPLIAHAANVEDLGAAAATDAAMVWAINGAEHTDAINNAHDWLIWGVGFAFLVGFGIAIAIYRNGLGTAEKIKALPGVGVVHHILEKKYYIDEIYNFVWVKGCMFVAAVSRFFDTWFVDMIFNLLAKITERIAAFSGRVLDAHGVDGIINGIADSAINFGGVMQRPQTGRIRNYVLFAIGAATIVVFCVLYFGLQSASASTVGAG